MRLHTLNSHPLSPLDPPPSPHPPVPAGEDEVEQLACIMEVLGPPPADVLAAASRRKLFFDTGGAPKLAPNSAGKTRHPGAKTLQGALKCSDQPFLDLVTRCLRWDPAERVTPDAALSHVWIVDNAPSPTARVAAGPPSGATSSRSGKQGGNKQGSARAAAVNLTAPVKPGGPVLYSVDSSGTGAAASARGSGALPSVSLGPVKPLNLSGLQGFAATSAAKPPGTPRGQRRESYGEAAQGAQRALARAPSTTRSAHQHALATAAAAGIVPHTPRGGGGGGGGGQQEAVPSGPLMSRRPTLGSAAVADSSLAPAGPVSSSPQHHHLHHQQQQSQHHLQQPQQQGNGGGMGTLSSRFLPSLSMAMSYSNGSQPTNASTAATAATSAVTPRRSINLGGAG